MMRESEIVIVWESDLVTASEQYVKTSAQQRQH